MAIAAAGMCLLVSLALIALGAISTRHIQMLLQEQYGTALAKLVAARISTAMERGDLLSISATLQRLMETSTAQSITITDVDGKTLGQAGDTHGQNLYRYSAPVHIESDIAGKIVIVINADNVRAAQLRFLLSMLGLAVLLSLAVFGISRRFGQRLGGELSAMGKKIALEEDGANRPPANELLQLGQKIDALPMDLLRTRSEPEPQDENYRTTAVLYLHLSSLVGYVDTLDERALQRYTERLHQVVYAASGFYAGELQVARQFGLAIYFTDHNSAGSAAFRAASCAWLVRAVSRAMEEHMSLSLSIAMAISQSELGVGSGTDIYPGLYTQHTLDELQAVCASKPPHILLSPAVCEDLDVAGRLQHRPTDVMDYALIEEFAGPYQDLLERQLRLILKRLTDPARR
jgi:hypothetical protein